jgi:hypothetical protein
MSIYTFSDDLLVGTAREFTLDYKNIYPEYPTQWIYFSYLTSIGSILAHKVKLKSGLDIDARLYTLLLGESASRKSAALKTVTEFFTRQIDEFQYTAGVGSDMGLAHKLDNNNLLLRQDEFAQFLQKAAIKNAALLSMTSTLFDSNVYHNALKDKSVQIDNGYLSILACSTMDTYEELFNKSHLNIGFDNRLWIVPGKSKRIGLPDVIPLDRIEKHNDAITDIFAFIRSIDEHHYDGKRYIEFDPGVYTDVYLPFYNDIIPALGDDNVTKRLDSYAIRLLVLLSLVQKKRIIDEFTMNTVIEYIKWQAKARAELNPTGANNDVAFYEQAIMRYMEQHPNEAIWVSQLKTNLKRRIRNTGIEPFYRAVDNLKRGDIEAVDDRKVIYRGDVEERNTRVIKNQIEIQEI